MGKAVCVVSVSFYFHRMICIGSPGLCGTIRGDYGHVSCAAAQHRNLKHVPLHVAATSMTAKLAATCRRRKLKRSTPPGVCLPSRKLSEASNHAVQDEGIIKAAPEP